MDAVWEREHERATIDLMNGVDLAHDGRTDRFVVSLPNLVIFHSRQDGVIRVADPVESVVISCQRFVIAR